RAALHGGAAPVARGGRATLPEPVQCLPYHWQGRRGGAGPGGGDDAARARLAGTVSAGAGPTAGRAGPDRGGPVGPVQGGADPQPASERWGDRYGAGVSGRAAGGGTARARGAGRGGRPLRRAPGRAALATLAPLTQAAHTPGPEVRAYRSDEMMFQGE